MVILWDLMVIRDTMGFTIPLTSTFEELNQSWFKPLALFISPEGFDGKWLTAWVTVVVGQDPSTPKCCRWRSQQGVPSQRFWPTKFLKKCSGVLQLFWGKYERDGLVDVSKMATRLKMPRFSQWLPPSLLVNRESYCVYYISFINWGIMIWLVVWNMFYFSIYWE